MPGSFVVFTYQRGASPTVHAYAYDASGVPLTEEKANRVAAQLGDTPSAEPLGDLEIVVLPAEQARS